MPRPVHARLEDISDCIRQIDRLLVDKTLDELRADRIAVAALERFLEIISEASRHLPEGMKQRHPDVPWRQIADLGNRLRHAYQQIELDLLWNIHARDLVDLETAVTALLLQAGEH